MPAKTHQVLHADFKVTLNHGSFYSWDGPKYILFFFVAEEQGEQITPIWVLVVTELSELLFKCGECNFTFHPLHHIHRKVYYDADDGK